MLSTPPPRESEPLASSSGSSASNPQPTNETTSATTPSINIHSTTAITERALPPVDTIIEGTLPNDGFDDMYDDSRHNSPEANAGTGTGLPDLPPVQEGNVRSEPLISSTNSQPVATTPAAPASAAGVPRTTARAISSAWNSALPLPERNSPLGHRPTDWITPVPYSSINIHDITSTNSRNEPQNPTPGLRTTSPVASRQLEAPARSLNRIPNYATNAWTVRPDAAARNSNRILDAAEILAVDALEALQVTHQPSDLSPQASSRTLSGSDQTAVGFLASNSPGRDIPQGPSGSTTGSSAKYENGSQLYGPEIDNLLHIDIETAIREKFDTQLGATLLCVYANDCHKQDEIRKRQQKRGDAPLSPLFPSIENNSTAETESRDEHEANADYIYNVRPHTLTSNGTEVKTLKAHPGNAVWALVERRLGSVDDPRRWETACRQCSTIIDSRVAIYCQSCTEQRERTISPEEAAVDDNRNQTAGATLALASGQATTFNSRSRVTRQANANVNSNANGTQTRPPPHSRPSGRTRRPPASEPEVPAPAPEPPASSSRHSQRHALSSRGSTLSRINGDNTDQVQTFDNYTTNGADNEDDEQGRRGGKKEKKSVSWDPKENGPTNSKRKASNAVEVLDGGRIRARATRRRVSVSSNELTELQASQQSPRSAAAGTLATGSGTDFGAGTSSSGANLITPNVVAAHAPDPVTNSTSPSTPSSPRRESSNAGRPRLRLIQVPEADPEHQDHEAYSRRQARRRMRRE